MELQRRGILILLFFFIQGFAFATSSNPFLTLWKKHPFYVGPLIGYGSTDWSMLVAHCDPKDKNCSLTILQNSAPLGAGDSGITWGATLGYEVKPFWAVESTFIRFPNTTILFNGGYNFYFDKYNLTTLRSTTWALMIDAKFMTQIAHSAWRGFANAGMDVTFRNDTMTHAAQISPTFGVGVDYLVNSHFLVEFGFQYVAGYGQANEMPVEKYMPFLYSIHLKLLYRF